MFTLVSGICYDSYGAGDMNIKVRTGSCDNGHHHGNAYTGWRTDSTMIIEEVDMRYNSGNVISECDVLGGLDLLTIETKP